MNKYVINHSIDGFNTVDITDERLISSESTVVLLLDESTNDKLYSYYNRVLEIIMAKGKLVTIVVGKESKIRKAICTLMASYRNYNMYYVDSLDIVDEEFINSVLERQPSYEEVQTFIGGDVSGYADISAVVLGINSIVNSGELDGLSTFINNHITSIESFPEVIDYMKKVVDTANSGELFTKIDELKDEAKKLQGMVEEYKKEIKELKAENATLNEDLTTAKKELGRSKTKIDELKEQVSGKGSIIRTYHELNTAIMKCKVMNILYFKEVSYVQYTNSLINSIAEALKAKKLRFKILIYDNKSSISNIYRPAPVIGSAEYLANKATFLKATERLVVVEPNPMIIEDVLTYTSPSFDVVIVYDRLKQSNDIVIGNNVNKYFVINSYKDYIESKNILKITDASHIITHTGGSLHTGVRYEDGTQHRIKLPKERLDIPKIDGYDRITDTAKVSKYMKLVSSISKKPVIGSIFDRMRI